MLQVIHTTPRSRRAPGGVFAPGGGGPAHAAWERLLLSLCLLASLLLLYRCLAITGGLLFGGGGSSSGDGSADTVISVTTAGAASITVLSSRRAAGRQAPAQQQPGGVLPRDFDAQVRRVRLCVHALCADVMVVQGSLLARWCRALPGCLALRLACPTPSTLPPAGLPLVPP